MWGLGLRFAEIRRDLGPEVVRLAKHGLVGNGDPAFGHSAGVDSRRHGLAAGLDTHDSLPIFLIALLMAGNPLEFLPIRIVFHRGCERPLRTGDRGAFR